MLPEYLAKARAEPEGEPRAVVCQYRADLRGHFSVGRVL